MRFDPDVVDTARMQSQRKCSNCGGIGHNSRGCIARPGTFATPPASAEAVPFERGVKRTHSAEDESFASDSEAEQSAQRKERKRGVDKRVSFGVLSCSETAERCMRSDLGCILMQETRGRKRSIVTSLQGSES